MTPPPLRHDPALVAAYKKTCYRVYLADRDVELRIDHYDPDAEALIRKDTGCKNGWAIITPCNPRSEIAREHLNLFYFNNLRYELEHKVGVWFKALNHDPDGEWPDEPGFFLVDPDLRFVVDLGRQCGQNAIVAARLGEAPRLVWLD